MESNLELGKKMGMSVNAINKALVYLDVDESIRKKVSAGTLNQIQARTIAGSFKDKKLQKEVSKIAEDLTWRDTEKLVSTIKKVTPDIKKALLNKELNIEQAERISKLKPEQRKKAIQEHKNISMVEKGVERNIKNQESAKEKKEFDKRLLQAGNWIASFRGSVTDSFKSLEKTIKVLLISTQFINVMDEKQKEKLEEQLDRFLEILNKAKQLSEQIEEKIK